ncbi:MAG: asparagine synthetase B [Armatimonadetes bacterium]|nr:asparagine synthetase B [Armatimonadota bacterium]
MAALVTPGVARASWLIVPMDQAQTDHLRAYGLTYWCLQAPRGYRCEWLLNYRYGSFLVPDAPDVRSRARELGVAVQPVSDAQVGAIYNEMRSGNMERIVLTRAARIAVYVPPDAEPWDDAVTLALTYAQVPYQKVWDPELLAGALGRVDWLHLHHEDFTGQFGKFWASFGHEPWYQKMTLRARQTAAELGFASVQELKTAVALKIAGWVQRGGFLFAMCLAADSLDVALAAQGVDIVPPQIDGTPADPQADKKLDFSQTFAFRNFHLVADPRVSEISDIDVQPPNPSFASRGETFQLFDFSARQDPICTMLVQCHTRTVPDFLGQTSAFRRSALKDTVIVLGDFPGQGKVKYIHGDYGKGTFTFLAGHDPEDYAHIVGEPPTDLSLHKHSPGYRLILNNILFPAAKVRQRKT